MRQPQTLLIYHDVASRRTFQVEVDGTAFGQMAENVDAFTPEETEQAGRQLSILLLDAFRQPPDQLAYYSDPLRQATGRMLGGYRMLPEEDCWDRVCVLFVLFRVATHPGGPLLAGVAWEQRPGHPEDIEREIDNLVTQSLMTYPDWSASLNYAGQ